MYNIVDKKKAIIDCNEVDDAKRAEAIFKVDVPDAQLQGASASRALSHNLMFYFSQLTISDNS